LFGLPENDDHYTVLRPVFVNPPQNYYKLYVTTRQSEIIDA